MPCQLLFGMACLYDNEKTTAKSLELGERDWTGDGVMLDFETVGFDGEKSAIIQIGAVGFRNDFVEDGRTFSANLKIPSNRHITESVVWWWMEDERIELFRKLRDNLVDPSNALFDFKRFCGDRNVWAWPMRFEGRFLPTYYRDYLPGQSPQDLSEKLVCAEWWSKGLSRMIGVHEMDRVRICNEKSGIAGEVHEAVFDCRWTLEVLRNLRKFADG